MSSITYGTKSGTFFYINICTSDCLGNVGVLGLLLQEWHSTFETFYKQMLQLRVHILIKECMCRECGLN